ncbi:MAG: right-handed parallel beta-helix repeat-containing protein [Candidatus Hodarchaeales archaeon]
MRFNNSIKFILLILILQLSLEVSSNQNGSTDINHFKFKPSQIASDPLIIDNDLSLEFFASRGSGTREDPYIIDNRQIQTWNTQQHGIVISGTSKYFEIRDNLISTGDLEGYYGIYIQNVATGTAKISSNVLESNYVGIVLDIAPNTIISQNYISHTKFFGIQTLDGSENTVIESNLIEFALNTSINVESEGSTIFGNNVTTDFNPAFSVGIAIHRDNILVQDNYVRGYWEGINLSPISNAIVTNNTVEGCSSGITGWPNNSEISANKVVDGSFDGNGIRLQGEVSNWAADNNEITFNDISNFPKEGFVARENSKNNFISNNIFTNNNQENGQSSQGLDNSTGNIIEHNYWSDWISPDENVDGIVDVPYLINGIAVNIDNQPVASIETIQILMSSEFHSDENNINDEFLEILDFNSSLAPILIVVSLFTVIAIPTYKIYQTIANRAITNLITGTLNEMIGFAPPLLVAIINGDQEISAETEDVVPIELQKFKFLLNPIKLAVIKVLYQYSSYPAYIVRELLQISWGKFSSHTKSLIEKGYISSQEEFYDGSPTRILRIERLGRIEYQELRDVLKRLFEIDKY